MNAAFFESTPNGVAELSDLDLIVDSRPEKKAASPGDPVWFGNSKET